MQPSLKQSEVERLAAVFRENPRSVAFMPLAQAYLASDRVADAIDVLEQGLAVHPDHAEGRLALGRALALLHRWKDAELELVRAVKLDRYSQQAFSLLGEILARRGNFDVAVKALTRACDLDPTDDRARRALERARIRRPLDPPPPLAGETQAVAQNPGRPLALGSSVPAVSPFDEMDEGPTVVTLTPMAAHSGHRPFAGAGDESADTSVVLDAAGEGEPEVLELPADLDGPLDEVDELAGLVDPPPLAPEPIESTGASIEAAIAGPGPGRMPHAASFSGAEDYRGAPRPTRRRHQLLHALAADQFGDGQLFDAGTHRGKVRVYDGRVAETSRANRLTVD
jgi:tetratricopeptide (TPR) repeat protein